VVIRLKVLLSHIMIISSGLRLYPDGPFPMCVFFSKML